MAVAGMQAETPAASEEAVAVLGVTSGIPQNAGFVFVDGEYLTPPYTVTRRGDAIFVNRILVEQPVPWTALTAVVAAGMARQQEAAGDAAVAAQGGDFDDIFDIDDIFGDDDFVEVGGQDDFVEVVPAPKKPAAERVVRSIDDLFGDDDEAQVVNQPAALRMGGGVPQADADERLPATTDKELIKAREDLKSRLETQRRSIESGLEMGEIFLFSQKHGRINGTYGTARTLIKVLPDAMRYATSAQDMMQRLNNGGVYFLGVNQCIELYQHRLRFPLLQSRLKRIEQQERVAAELRRRKN